MATLIKIDRNGSKHYEGYITCDRCGGQGGAEQWKFTGYSCYKCGGTGKVLGKWIERTPEYQAKLDARRAEKAEANRIKWAAEEAERIQKELAELDAKKEAERIKAEEEKARKAISQYVGEEGQRIEMKATFLHSAWFEVKSFSGYGTETMYVHNFADANGNKFVWKTGKGLGTLEEGQEVTIKGTVKEHKEYKEEKQTVLTRCKIIR